MKFLKQSQLNKHNLKDRDVSVQLALDADPGVAQYKRVVLDVPNGAILPRGNTAQRPTNSSVNGMVRYNTQTEELEVRQNGSWRRVAFKEPHTMTLQNLGNGDAAEVYFGPLVSGSTNLDGSPYVPDLANPQNILVFIENVPQLAGTNYSLVDNPPSKPAGRYIEFDSPVPFGKPVNVLHGIDR